MSIRRRLLMIAYYFPPMGMGGVQRPLKFAKYLPEFGWDVTVITAATDGYHAHDETLLGELPDTVDVVRVKSLDPAKLVRRGESTLSNATSSRSPSTLTREIQQWSRWPDAKIHFARIATREARRLAGQHSFDAIYTTSPPPSVHFAGLRLQDKLRIPWAADFRDPWLVRADDWGPTAIHRRYAQHLRSRILRRANHTLAMNNQVASQFRQSVNEATVTVIPNGYDEADFTNLVAAGADANRTIAFYGTLSPETDIKHVLNLVDAYNEQNPNQPLRVRHIGQIIGMDPIAHPAFESTGYLPHAEAIRQLSAADVIALALDSDPGLRMTIPGRTYEVLRSLRPIVALVPNEFALSDALDSIAGVWLCDPGDLACGLSALTAALALKRDAPARDVASLEPLSRKSQTSRLVEILEELVGHAEAEQRES